MKSLKTLIMLMQEWNQEWNKNFLWTGFQPIDLDTSFKFNWKEYIFGIPFTYYLDINKKKKINFQIKESVISLFPYINLLEEEKWIFSWYNLILELTKKYKRGNLKETIINNIINNTKQLIQDNYLIEKKTNIKTESILSEIYEVSDINFDDLLTWKTSLIKENKNIVGIKVISKEQVNAVRKSLGLNNISIQTLAQLKWIVKSLGLIEEVRELNSNQARTYYLRLITDYISRKISLGRDLTNNEKKEIVKSVNEFIDAIANFVIEKI